MTIWLPKNPKPWHSAMGFSFQTQKGNTISVLPFSDGIAIVAESADKDHNKTFLDLVNSCEKVIGLACLSLEDLLDIGEMIKDCGWQYVKNCFGGQNFGYEIT